MRMYDEAQSAPMSVAHSTGGPQPTIELDLAGLWQPEDDRRHQAESRCTFARIAPALVLAGMA